MFADWTDRIAAGELPRRQAAAAARRRAQHRHHRCGTGPTPKAYLHDEISTDKRNPTVNANGQIYGSPRRARDIRADPRSGAQHATSQVKLPVRDPNTPSTEDDPILRPRPIGATRRSGTARPPSTIPMFDEGPGLVHARIRPPDNPAFCKQGSDHPSAKLFPLESPAASWRCYDPNDRQVHADRHLLHAPTICNSRRTPTIRCGPARRSAATSSAGSTPRCSTRPATRQKSQGLDARSSSTPTATASATIISSPNQPVDPDEGQAHQRGILRRRAEPGRRLGLGLGARLSGRRRAARTRAPIRRQPRWRNIYEVPLDETGRRCTATRRAAWTSTATAWSGRRSPAAISPASTAASAKARSTARRATGQAMSGRLDALSVPGTAIRGCDRFRQRRGELLHLGRSA